MSPPRLRHAILDRDGVLNRELETGWVSSPSQWQWEEGSLEALRSLTDAGVRISVVSNQSGIGRGVVSAEEVDGVHRWLKTALASEGVELGGIYICPHAPGAGCECRKPLPGLVRQAMAASGIPAASSTLIGDDLRDLEAAHSAGISALLVRSGKGASVEDQVGPNTLVFENLLAAVNWLIGTRTGETGVPPVG